MSSKPIIAPVIPYHIDSTDPGTAPAQIWDGTGTVEMVCCADGPVGILFGANADMEVAAADNSFPISTEWVRLIVGPATRFISVFDLSGNAGVFYYYFPGQTDPDV